MIDSRLLDPAERERLETCVREAIRTPGAIQNHGFLLGLNPESLLIESASDNWRELLGMPAPHLFGRSTAEVFGAELHAGIQGVLNGDRSMGNPVHCKVADQGFDVIVHDTAAAILVEFEPSISLPSSQSPPTLYRSILGLAAVNTIAELRVETARELRRLTGFDRVMMYHFHPDGHGEIVAEELADGMEPYLGLHYPASDIPAQARDLYLTKLSRAVVTSADDSVALLAATGTVGPSGLDLSPSELRAVSPHHLKFMRNMGQESTFAISLVDHGELIGLITCAHRTTLRLPFVLRRGLEILGNQVAMKLSSIQRIDELTRQASLAGVRRSLVAHLDESPDLDAALLGGAPTVLDLIPADGVVLLLAGARTSLGDVPSPRDTAELLTRLAARQEGLALTTDSVEVDHPELAEVIPDFAGVLVVPLGSAGDCLAFFRHEVLKTVEWLGDQRPANRETTLSPRSSFSAWSQSVSGSAPPWGVLADEAAELARDLDGALLHLAESKLASLANFDPLTDLPNRRMLMSRLEHALARYARGADLALLFIDLDGLKVINDANGHEAGDAVIVEMGRRILSVSRAQDTVARIGGDEFVILCENTTSSEAEVIGARVVSEVRRPILVAGLLSTVTASVGVTMADLPFTGSELLQQADAAMYRAKTGGRDRVSR